MLLLNGGSCSAPSPSVEGAADTVYTNGRIYTVNEAEPWVEAVAIKDGKFLVVGSNADVEAVTGEGTEINDLQGPSLAAAPAWVTAAQTCLALQTRNLPLGQSFCR